MKNTSSNFSQLFNKDQLSSLEALDRAQMIAFAPYVWEATELLLELEILSIIDQSGRQGMSMEAIQNKIDFPSYGIRILMEASLGLALTYLKEGKYCLAKTGYFLLHNEMTQVNFHFMKDICLPGIGSLKQSILKEKPIGLLALGNWATIYEGLSELPAQAQESWLNFDHFYSDRSFKEILNILATYSFQSILDIGGNTGKWTTSLLNLNMDLKVGFVDLPGQVSMAQKELKKHPHYSQIEWFPQNILDSENQLPPNYDAIWMSQFLDCFSDEQISNILQKCYERIEDHGYLFINETFWDRQQFTTSAFALQMTSFYFTSMANGNSQMYDSKVFFKLVQDAGFNIVNIHDLLGHSHTLLILQKR